MDVAGRVAKLIFCETEWLRLRGQVQTSRKHGLQSGRRPVVAIRAAFGIPFGLVTGPCDCGKITE
jgi:hypothetical protein